jgi:ATP-dependent helicase/nuclease subunit A
VWSGDGEDPANPFVASPLDELRRRDENARKLEEFDRWLYVALTRAKSTLTLSWSKIHRHSWASRSDWFMREPGVHRGPFYNFEIREGETDERTNQAAKRESPKPRKAWREDEGDHLERLSVTELIGAKSHELLPREDLLKRWQAQNQGTRIHRSLEALKYGMISGESDSADQATAFVLQMTNPPMRELIHQGEAEWGFQVRTPTRVVEGQIDLWSKHDGTLYVVDYKSGSAAFKQSAFDQLSLYAWALRKFGHKEPAKMLVIYPLTGKFEMRDFTEDLFDSWELKFSGAEA